MALTTGIMSHQVESSSGNMIIYDLAGRGEYFSSHSACLEAISLNSPATFILTQDLRKDPEAITRELHYWATMIDSVCHKCPLRSSVIVVGTHADILTPGEVTSKITHVHSVAGTAFVHQKLVKVVALSLNNIYKDEMNQFMNLLHETNQNVLRTCPSISRMCHVVLSFMYKVVPSKVDALTLSDLLEHLKADKTKLIDQDISCIIPILKTLSEKGFIIYIPSEDPLHSWIVLNKGSILTRVNGSLFADSSSFNEHAHLNTGIIRKSVLAATFPEYNIEMIVQFMIHFQLCRAVDINQLGTNSPGLDPLLFFPALVNIGRPSSATVSSKHFSWSIIVRSTNQVFIPRFLHVLLCRLLSDLALPIELVKTLYPGFSHSWDVWCRGIKCLSEARGVTIVEMDEMFKSVSMAISSPDKKDLKYPKLAQSVISVIKTTCQEFCPHVDVLEIISCPPEATSDHSNDTKVELSLLKKAILEGNRHIVDLSGQKYVEIGEWMMIEPCLPYLIGGETIDAVIATC